MSGSNKQHQNQRHSPASRHRCDQHADGKKEMMKQHNPAEGTALH
jgi:hypothetical protein